MTTKKKDLKIYIPLTVIILLVIAAGIYWYNDYEKYIKTDDALVASDVVTVSPKHKPKPEKIRQKQNISLM